MATIYYSPSFLSFLGDNYDCKISQLLYRLYYKQRRNWQYNSKIITDKECNYITFRVDGTISYLPFGKELKHNDNGEWSREGRQNGKPSKVIRKILSARAQKWYKDTDFECFANRYKARYSSDGYKFDLLSHLHIPDVYCMPQKSGDGALNNSCMNGDRSYLQIYAGCKKLQILTMVDKEGLLHGRALVWSIDKDTTLMDRVYCVNDYEYDMFLAYCEDKKWHRKKYYKSYDCKTTFINPSGKEIQANYEIETPTDFDYYPYIDTFSYGDDGTLNNYGSGCYSYNNTGGDRDGESNPHEGQRYDDINDEWIDEDDSIYLDGRGEIRYNGMTTHIDNAVEVNGRYYYEDDENITIVNSEYYRKDDSNIVFSDFDDEYYISDDCVFSEHHNSYILESDSVKTVDGEYFHENEVGDSVIEIEGDYYDKDSDDIVEIDDEWYLKDNDDVIEIDVEFYLKSTIKKALEFYKRA